MTRTAGQAVVGVIEAAGCRTAFAVPGESFLAIHEAMVDSATIKVVTTRHENGAAFMAEAYAKLTRQLSACLATRTVGAGNLAIGLHTALQDSSPVLAVLGDVATSRQHREAFQESTLAGFLAPITKWSATVPSATRAADVTARAIRTALAGRPGPVAVTYPDDLLDVEVPPHEPDPTSFTATAPAPQMRAVLAALDALRAARFPVMVVGLGVLASPGATEVAITFAEREELAVIASWRRPDAFPNDHRLYLGQSGLSSPPSVKAHLAEADVVLAVGCRFNEPAVFDYAVPTPGATIIHVDLEPGVPIEGTGPRLSITADAGAFFGHAVAPPAPEPELLAGRRAANAERRRRWERETTPTSGKAGAGFADQQRIVAHLRQVLTPDTIVACDAGNFSGWPARYLRWHQPGTFLGPISGAMGYGLPAAIAAALARPDRPVVGFAGDGGFFMTGSELETAARLGVSFTMLVYDNEQYGTIRMHGERRPTTPVNAADITRLGPIDVAGYARALGAHACTVEHADQFADAFAAAQSTPGPSVIAIRTDPDQLSVGADAS